MHSDLLDECNSDSCKQLTALLGLIRKTLDIICEEIQRYRQEELTDNVSRPNVSKRIAKLSYRCLANADPDPLLRRENHPPLKLGHTMFARSFDFCLRRQRSKLSLILYTT